MTTDKLKCKTCNGTEFKFYNFKPSTNPVLYLGVFCKNCWECYNFSLNEPIQNIFLRLEGKISELAEGLEDIYPDPDVYMKSPLNGEETFKMFWSGEKVCIRTTESLMLKAFDCEEKIKELFEYLKI